MEIEILSAEGFRRRLAGLEDPSRKIDAFDTKAIEADATSFIAIIPEVFGDDLDRKTLWERIANGIATATAKSGGDLGSFFQEILTYVKAEPGKVACNERLALYMETLLSRPAAIQDQFIRTISGKSYLIVTRARGIWNANKAQTLAPKEGGVL